MSEQAQPTQDSQIYTHTIRKNMITEGVDVGRFKDTELVHEQANQINEMYDELKSNNDPNRTDYRRGPRTHEELESKSEQMITTSLGRAAIDESSGFLRAAILNEALGNRSTGKRAQKRHVEGAIGIARSNATRTISQAKELMDKAKANRN